jgi:GT2 family glycosyltransferase
VRTGRARNLGAAALPPGCTFMVMTDSDALLEPTAIATFQAAHRRHPDAIIFGVAEWLPPLPLDAVGRRLREGGVAALRPELPQVPTYWERGTFVGKDMRVGIFSDDPDALYPAIEPHWNLTVLAGLPLALFRALGGFDERMVGYGHQDIEFGIRLARSGAPALALSTICCLHVWHEKLQELRLAENQRNIDYVLRKHGAVPIVEGQVDWRYWWHYRRERGGRLLAAEGGPWAVNAAGSHRLGLPGGEWIARLGFGAADVQPAPIAEVASIPIAGVAYDALPDEVQPSPL